MLKADGASIDTDTDVVKGRLGNFVTSDDIDVLTQNLDLEDFGGGNISVGRSNAINLLPLEAKVIERFSFALFTDNRVAKAQARIDNLSSSHPQLQARARATFNRALSNAKNKLIDEGFRPKKDIARSR